MNPTDLPPEIAGLTDLTERAGPSVASEVANALLARLRADALPSHRGWALICAARAESMLGQSDRGLEHAERAAQILDGTGDSDALLEARLSVVYLRARRGDYEIALELGQGMLAMARELGSDAALARAFTGLGMAFGVMQQYDTAREFLEAARAPAQRLGDPVIVARVLSNLGVVLDCLAQGAAAAGDAAKARTLSDQAVTELEHASRILQDGGFHGMHAWILSNLAYVNIAAGRLEAAREQAIRAAAAVPNGANDCVALVTGMILGRVAFEQGDTVRAIAEFERAIDLADRIVALREKSIVLEMLSRAHEAAGDPQSALDCYRRFHALRVRMLAEMAQKSASSIAVQAETRRVRKVAEEAIRQSERLQVERDELRREAQRWNETAFLDPLTGLPNRRALEARLDELDRNRRGRRFCVAVIDADHFKRINDAFLHETGDRVLRQLGEIMRKALRPTDLIARVGGEEFAWVVAGVDEAHARRVCERLRSTVEMHPWDQIVPGIVLTVSIGMAAGDESTEVRDIYRLADQRLYQAKHEGRNRVC